MLSDERRRAGVIMIRSQSKGRHAAKSYLCLRKEVSRSCPGWAKDCMAERVGFEPTLEFPLNTLSKRAPSTTRPSLQSQTPQRAWLDRIARRRFDAVQNEIAFSVASGRARLGDLEGTVRTLLRCLCLRRTRSNLVMATVRKCDPGPGSALGGRTLVDGSIYGYDVVGPDDRD